MRMAVKLPGVAILALVSAAAFAANWQKVADAEGGRVEIDKSSILRTAQGQTSAWTRRLFDHAISTGGIRYSAVLTLNRYDCAQHRFATAKRVFMLEDKVVREDKIGRPQDASAAAGSDDAALLGEACKLRTVGEANDVAAAAAAAAEQAKPGVMYADMRTAAGEKAPVKTIPVADAAKPEVQAEAPAEAKPRPRFIELPKIDKSKVEDPFAGMKPGEAKPEPGKPSPTPKVVEKPVEPPAAATGNRHEIERQYATSGPRKTRPASRQKPKPAKETYSYAHWGYEGDGAPSNWAKLRPDFATCGNGRRQSPIDIRDGIRVDLEPIGFDYLLSRFRIIDTGHSIQVNVGEGSTMTVMGRTYRLVQFHFHRPAEERVAGHRYDMGIHFVHKDDEGHLAVVTVLLEKGPIENPLIQTLWNNLPLEVDQEVSPAIAIDLKNFLPENRAYYTFMGSLTTPPCTEDVLWMVLKQPMPISAEQAAIFARLYPNNARPIQPLNGRLIKESR